MDKLSAMKAFVRVVEAGTFTKAADSLGVPKAQVSRLVQSLDQFGGAGAGFGPLEGGLQSEERAARVGLLFQPVGVDQPEAVVVRVGEQVTEETQVIGHDLDAAFPLHLRAGRGLVSPSLRKRTRSLT